MYLSALVDLGKAMPTPKLRNLPIKNMVASTQLLPNTWSWRTLIWSLSLRV